MSTFLANVAAASEPQDSASLDRLHDIVVPERVPWWPLAPGWYLIAAALILTLGYFGLRAFLQYRANAYRRAALSELENLVEQADVRGVSPTLAAIAELLKRVALAVAPREKIAVLTGEGWIAWLNEHGGGTLFEADNARLLTETVYWPTSGQRISREQLNCLVRDVRAWILSHRIEYTNDVSGDNGRCSN